MDASETDEVDEEEVVADADDEQAEEPDAKLTEAELSDDIGDNSFSLISIISVLFVRLIF